MTFDYFTRSTELLEDGKTLYCYYTNFFNASTVSGYFKSDKGISYYELSNNMIIFGNRYSTSINHILHDMLSVKDCYKVIVNGHVLITSRYTEQEISTFIRIISDNFDEEFCVEFYFMSQSERFMVYC